MIFGKTYGLDIDAKKSSIFFGGVLDSLKQIILHDTSFIEGTFVFNIFEFLLVLIALNNSIFSFLAQP